MMDLPGRGSAILSRAKSYDVFRTVKIETRHEKYCLSSIFGGGGSGRLLVV